MPVASDSPSMHDVAKTLLDARKELGIKRYGIALQANNGRNAAQDCLEEALDVAVYASQVMWEVDHPEDTYVGCLIEALVSGRPLDFKGRFVPDAVQKLLGA